MVDNAEKSLLERKLKEAEQNLGMLERKRVQVISCHHEWDRVGRLIVLKKEEIEKWKTKIGELSHE